MKSGKSDEFYSDFFVDFCEKFFYIILCLVDYFGLISVILMGRLCVCVEFLLFF